MIQLYLKWHPRLVYAIEDELHYQGPWIYLPLNYWHIVMVHSFSRHSTNGILRIFFHNK